MHYHLSYNISFIVYLCYQHAKQLLIAMYIYTLCNVIIMLIVIYKLYVYVISKLYVYVHVYVYAYACSCACVCAIYPIYKP